MLVSVTSLHLTPQKLAQEEERLIDLRVLGVQSHGTSMDSGAMRMTGGDMLWQEHIWNKTVTSQV